MYVELIQRVKVVLLAATTVFSSRVDVLLRLYAYFILLLYLLCYGGAMGVCQGDRKLAIECYCRRLATCILVSLKSKSMLVIFEPRVIHVVWLSRAYRLHPRLLNINQKIQARLGFRPNTM